ncbi:hypothetical protein CB1_001136003 [Camelus ferus]|nr:hypothetical protein CB1_001136003 [Camelus ferus]
MVAQEKARVVKHRNKVARGHDMNRQKKDTGEQLWYARQGEENRLVTEIMLLRVATENYNLRLEEKFDVCFWDMEMLSENENHDSICSYVVLKFVISDIPQCTYPVVLLLTGPKLVAGIEPIRLAAPGDGCGLWA